MLCSSQLAVVHQCATCSHQLAVVHQYMQKKRLEYISGYKRCIMRSTHNMILSAHRGVSASCLYLHPRAIYSRLLVASPPQQTAFQACRKFLCISVCLYFHALLVYTFVHVYKPVHTCMQRHEGVSIHIQTQPIKVHSYTGTSYIRICKDTRM